MIKIKNKEQCCGCTACMNVCPQNCIEMKPDNEGFLYPKVNETLCIGCNKCNTVCPMTMQTNGTNEKPQAFIVRLLDENALKESASGGFYSALSHTIVNQGGVACGASYDNEFMVSHTLAYSEESCNKFRGSKYVQSYLGNIFFEIKSLLEKGVKVCFSGTPCQVVGLKNYLKADFENLITTDLVCAGVPSSKLWHSYLDMKKLKFKSQVSYANFRHKTYGYQCSTLRLEFENGKVYSHSGRVDEMMNFFVSGIAKRWSCYTCPFRGVMRYSDFTMFDAWHAEKLSGIRDDNKGWTCLMVHTKKGMQLLNFIKKEVRFLPVDFDEAVKLDGVMVNNQPIINEKRKEFYLTLDKKGISACREFYMTIRFRDYILEIVKPFLYKSGMIQYVKMIKEKLK